MIIDRQSTRSTCRTSMPCVSSVVKLSVGQQTENRPAHYYSGGDSLATPRPSAERHIKCMSNQSIRNTLDGLGNAVYSFLSGVPHHCSVADFTRSGKS